MICQACGKGIGDGSEVLRSGSSYSSTGISALIIPLAISEVFFTGVYASYLQIHNSHSTNV